MQEVNLEQYYCNFLSILAIRESDLGLLNFLTCFVQNMQISQGRKKKAIHLAPLVVLSAYW